MKRKDYQKPTMRVVKLLQQTHLLYGSPTGTLPDSQDPEQQNWP